MKLSLRYRILAGYALILLLLLFILLFSLFNLQRLGRASASILRENYRSIIAAEHMIGAIERQDSALLLILAGYAEEGQRQFARSLPDFMQWLGREKDNITIEGEAQLAQAIETGYLAYVEASQPLLGPQLRGRQQAGSYYHTKVLPLFLEVRRVCDQLREMNQVTMYDSSEHAHLVAGRATTSLLATGSAVIVLGLFFSFFLSNLVVRPLARVIEGIHSIEKGDFEVQVDSASEDELGRLAAAFNHMARQLRQFHELNIGRIMAEKRKSETIVRTIDDGIVVVDPEARVIDLNPKAAEILGLKAVDLHGEHFLELWANEEVFRQIKQVLAEGKAAPSEGEDNTLTIRQGEQRRHYQLLISPIQNKPGRTQGAVLLLRDVTRLKELDQLKSEFIMKASHELKNPLTGLTMNMELLRESTSERLGQKEQLLLSGAEEDLRRLRGLVNDLLDLSRMEAGKLTMEIGTAAVEAIVERCLVAMRAQAGELGIELSAALPEALPPVLADPNKILWVITNLVANALRYTPRGGFVRISAEAEESRVLMEVRDNGQGIPYEDQGRLFEKFFQARGGASGSLGIGLAICKEIVRAHRGAIWVDSAPGKGSVFSFTLPRADRG